MTLLTRITRLVRADLHAMLDGIEEPELVLEQSIREMQEAIDADARALAHGQQQDRTLAERQDELARLLDENQSQLDVCLDEEQDDLARGLLRKRLELERLTKILEQRRKDLRGQIDTHQERLSARRARLDALKARAETLMPANTGDEPSTTTTPDLRIDEADVEVALLNQKRARRAS